MKKYIQNTEYMKARRNYLRILNRYQKQGYDISDKQFRPTIPKRPTTASLRNLQTLEERLKRRVHEERVETGYYTRQREQRAIQSNIRKAAQRKPKTTGKYITPKTPKGVKSRTHIPHVKGKQSQPPNVSDAVLRSFESEMAIAKNYVSKSAPFQRAVNEAGLEAQQAFDNKIDEILNKYLPDLTRHDVRVEVSKKLSENFANYISNIESYLYEFVSDGQGHLDHTQTGIDLMRELIDKISEAELSIEEQQELQEMANALTEGTQMEGENYDY